ncbi:hypothetical protein OQA88_8929 [Cercophora sp. LCS_1]
MASPAAILAANGNISRAFNTLLTSVRYDKDNKGDKHFGSKLFNGPLKKPYCAYCGETKKLSACNGCGVTYYCDTTHQGLHWKACYHKEVCHGIKHARADLEREEAKLPEGIFEFAECSSITKPYLKARKNFAEALINTDTIDGVKAGLDHFMEMLRLDRKDTSDVRDLVPGLLIRLGREQECYDFIKWWSVTDLKTYDWNNTSLPYQDIKNADVFEGYEDLVKTQLARLPHLCILALLKFRVALDLDSDTALLRKTRRNLLKSKHTMGEIADKIRAQRLPSAQVRAKVNAAKDQLLALVWLLDTINPRAWFGFFELEPKNLPRPLYWSPQGSQEQADAILYACREAWRETFSAIAFLETVVANFTHPYTGGEGERRSDLPKLLGIGKTFPTAFTPPAKTTPFDLYAATRAGFVSMKDPKSILLLTESSYMTKACGGWAVVYGPKKIIAGALEDFDFSGMEQPPKTNTRVELRGAVGALRMNDWAKQYTSLTIATSSQYVVDGATQWVKDWVRKDWKISTGKVKNRDLWKLLLGDIELYAERGLSVSFWRLPKPFEEAIAAARHIDNEHIPIFTDVLMPPMENFSGRYGVLIMALHERERFSTLYSNMVSRMRIKTEVSKAYNVDDAMLELSTNHPSPKVILVPDASPMVYGKLWDRIIHHLHDGATVILGGSFGNTATDGMFGRAFARVGLPWGKATMCHDVAVCKLQTENVSDKLARKLPAEYCQTGMFIEGVRDHEVWYSAERSASYAPEEPDQFRTITAFTKVGWGKFGYIGEINGLEETHKVILGMCGLL